MKPGINVEQIRDNLHLITSTSTFSVNSLLFTGVHGALLVDTGYHDTMNKFETILNNFPDLNLKYIINTHCHFDHTGANEILGKNAIIISHENARSAIRGDFYHLKGYLKSGTPEVTINDSLRIHLNNELIDITALPAGHTNGDLIVHFNNAGVTFLGDIFLANSFPNADIENGGEPDGLEQVFGMFPDILPENSELIPGHSRKCTLDELNECYEIIKLTKGIIQKEVNSGTEISKIIQMDELKKWEKGIDSNMITLELWAKAIYESIKRVENPERQSISVPLTKSIVENGIESTIAKFYELGGIDSKLYDTSERELNRLAYQLLFMKKFTEAIEIFKLIVETSPKSSNAYDSLGEGYLAAGEKILARHNYEIALKMDPKREYIKSIIEDLMSS